MRLKILGGEPSSTLLGTGGCTLCTGGPSFCDGLGLEDTAEAVVFLGDVCEDEEVLEGNASVGGEDPEQVLAFVFKTETIWDISEIEVLITFSLSLRKFSFSKMISILLESSFNLLIILSDSSFLESVTVTFE